LKVGVVGERGALFEWAEEYGRRARLLLREAIILLMMAATRFSVIFDEVK